MMKVMDKVPLVEDNPIIVLDDGDGNNKYISCEQPKKRTKCCSHFLWTLILGLLAVTGTAMIVCRMKQAVRCSMLDEAKEVKFSFASYYTDHMVLQRSPSLANIWGWAPLQDVGSEVVVTLANSDRHEENFLYKTVVKAGPVNDKAVWQVLLDPMEGSNAYEITAMLGANKVTISDVLFGDVWFCSGQSNMQFSVSSMFHASEELALAADYPRIRLYTVSDTTANTEQFDVLDASQVWTLPSEATVKGFAAVCWLYGKEIHTNVKYPIGLVSTCWGGTRIESWSSPDALKQCGFPNNQLSGRAGGPSNFHSTHIGTVNKFAHDDDVDFMARLQGPPQEPYVLWNAMIHPLLNMTMKGAIWYQGEANSDFRMDKYNCSLIAMIDDWREKFHAGSALQTSNMFPFGIVQLGPKYPETASTVPGFADIRWHQTADIGYAPNSYLKNVFMATAFDTTDFNSPMAGVHPRDKITPSHRLAIAGLAVAYGESALHYRGPTPTTLYADTDKHTLTVEYDWAQGDDYKIDVRAKFGFDVCCSPDGKVGCAMSGTDMWHEVNITDYTDYTVTLSWEVCAGMHVMGVRYAWRETPCPYLACPIYGLTTKLPATPFIHQGLISDYVTLSH